MTAVDARGPQAAMAVIAATETTALRILMAVKRGSHWLVTIRHT